MLDRAGALGELQFSPTKSSFLVDNLWPQRVRGGLSAPGKVQVPRPDLGRAEQGREKNSLPSSPGHLTRHPLR